MNTPFQKQQAGIREALKEGFKSRDVESRTWRQAIRILSTRDIECITTLSVSTLSLGDLLVSKEVGISLGAMVFLISFVTAVMKNTIDRGLQKRE